MADLRPAHDDSISGDDRLYFRFFADPDSAVPLGAGEFRPNSGSLKPRRKEEPLSADLASLCGPQETRDRGGHPGPFNVAVVSVAEARALGLRITRDPIKAGADGGPNPAHVLVHGDFENDSGDLTGGVRRKVAARLAHIARLALPPHHQPPT
jgi:hypothetical protein